MNEIFKDLISLIDIKEEKIQMILEKTILQSNAIKDKDVDKLMEATDLKQILIDELETINDEFNKKYKIVLNDGSSVEISNLKKRIDSIIKVINQIDSLEQENKKELSQQMDEVRQNLKKVNLGKKGMNAYFNKGNYGGSYIDFKN